MFKTSKDTLDPADWQAFRRDSHQMLDDMLDHLENLQTKPVWQQPPAELLSDDYAQLTSDATELKDLHQWFMANIVPYSVGNIHPGFMGWVHGAGTVVGMVAEMLAAGLNANVGGRYQAPIILEQQLTQWLKHLFSFPDSAGGLMVSGTSMANLIGVLIARTWFLGKNSRQQGLQQSAKRLVAYSSSSAHISLTQALEIAGLGSDALRLIPVNSQFQLDINALKTAIMADKANGFAPFLIAATAGSVDVGAIDPLPELAELAHQHGLWLHVDGAYAALAILSPELAPLLQGIQAADSLAFDFHKWGQVPYDAGFILVRDQQQQLATFASPAAYLMRADRGLAAGSPWPCDLGPELSRGFKALKTWFTLKAYGTQKLGHVIWHTCQLAHYLKEKILMCDKLELLAPVTLNIVCFRYRAEQADAVNAKIVIALQESGIAAPSTTKINTMLAIRVAIFNHRTTEVHIDAMLDACLRLGKQFSG